LTSRQIWAGVVIIVVLIVLIASFVRYHAGRHRREYDAVMLSTLDRLLTAQEGFFYDSSHYVGSLSALPTVRIPPAVHVELVNPDPRSWWGVATHGSFGGHRCVVWVGKAPASIPPELRSAENEAKPICFDDEDMRGKPGKGS
jgi:hypothetical protein